MLQRGGMPLADGADEAALLEAQLGVACPREGDGISPSLQPRSSALIPRPAVGGASAVAVRSRARHAGPSVMSGRPGSMQVPSGRRTLWARKSIGNRASPSGAKPLWRIQDPARRLPPATATLRCPIRSSSPPSALPAHRLRLVVPDGVDHHMRGGCAAVTQLRSGESLPSPTTAPVATADSPPESFGLGIAGRAAPAGHEGGNLALRRPGTAPPARRYSRLEPSAPPPVRRGRARGRRW